MTQPPSNLWLPIQIEQYIPGSPGSQNLFTAIGDDLYYLNAMVLGGAGAPSDFAMRGGVFTGNVQITGSLVVGGSFSFTETAQILRARSRGAR